jgi:mutator protein MutT
MKSLRDRVGTRLLLMPGVSAVIRNEAGAILLHRREDDGGWSLPAGAVDPGESPAQSIVREVREETGLDVVPERILGVFGGLPFRHTYPNGDEVEYTVIVFACRVVGGALEAQDGESLELRYFPPEELPPLEAPYPPELFHHPERETPLFF